MPISAAYIRLSSKSGVELVMRKDAILMARDGLKGENGNCTILLSTGERIYVAESMADVVTALMEEV